MSVMVMNVYVNFDGTCPEAFGHYAKHLSGTIDSMSTFRELPEPSQVDPD